MDTSGKTQREIAVEMGVPQPAVSRWLSGKIIPKDGALDKLAEVLGVDADELLVELRHRRLDRLEKNTEGTSKLS